MIPLNQVLTEIEFCQKIAYISDRRIIVQRLTEQILVHAEGLPEGTPSRRRACSISAIAPRWTRHCRDWLNVAG
jgi:hypothetical protein